MNPREYNPEPFLRPYQMDAVLKMRNGCILNGGVGSGKSRTGLYYYFKENGGSFEDGEYIPMIKPQDLYIITTALKRDSNEWDMELAYYLINTDPKLSKYKNKVVIDSWNNIKKYIGVSNAFFIFDEDRVTGRGVWVKAFLKIAKSNNWIILSATPGDTWQDYIPVFIANGFYRNRTDFNTQHVVWSRYTKYPKVDKYVNTKRLVRLRDNILIDMPCEKYTTPHHYDIYCDWDNIIYKDTVRNRWDPYKNEPLQQASSLCYVLRKIVNSSDDRTTKLLEILDDHESAIIFYNYDYELEILRSIDYGRDMVTAEWNGHKHQPVPFDQGRRWLYFVQYIAGCEGWNCIKTNCIIFYSQSYSYKQMTQAAGRIDRMNTPFNDLYYYHLKSRSGIDVAISKALKEKKEFNEGKYINRLYASRFGGEK